MKFSPTELALLIAGGIAVVGGVVAALRLGGREARLALVFVLLLAVGGGVGGGWVLGKKVGLGRGYEIGLMRGEVRAARTGPPEVRDGGWTAGDLRATEAWKGLGELQEGEAEALTGLLNQAPAPCWQLARRGVSLATTLMERADECAPAAEQVRLALVAQRTFPDDPREALAVLRVEKRVRPDSAGRPSRGNPDAEVVLVEWGDFECPYCARSQPLIEQVLAEREDVRVVFKHFPLSFHPAAMPAALAVEAAAEQEQFWEMHDALFALGKELRDQLPGGPVGDSGPVPFEAQAAEVGLDIERYRADFRSEQVLARVEGDLAEGRRIGVSGTPSFYVDARKVEERLSPAMLGRLIDRAVAERAWRFFWDMPAVPVGVTADDDDSGERP